MAINVERYADGTNLPQRVEVGGFGELVRGDVLNVGILGRGVYLCADRGLREHGPTWYEKPGALALAFPSTVPDKTLVAVFNSAVLRPVNGTLKGTHQACTLARDYETERLGALGIEENIVQRLERLRGAR
jgi:hypothetical protein